MSIGERFFNWTDKQSNEAVAYGLVVFVFVLWTLLIVAGGWIVTRLA